MIPRKSRQSCQQPFQISLVNGSTGISAGYATDIPPHNLAEVIDATVYMIDHPTAKVDKLMEFLPGPDFRLEGLSKGRDEIKKAYETGKGRVVVRSKTEIEKLKGGKEQIVITEIPYEINKANLVKKIDDVRVNNKVAGIAEVRDESDRDGLRIAIELRKMRIRSLFSTISLNTPTCKSTTTLTWWRLTISHLVRVGIVPILI